MNLIDQAEKRTRIRVAEAQERARQAAGQDATSTPEEMAEALAGGALILDGMRRRPRYFDGRFLTGADLTRDQDYVRQRQADMARAAGVGVISGLQVASRPLLRGETLRIGPGVGLTPSGSLVMLTSARDVPLADLPTVRELDAAMGLAEQPRVPIERRTGLYILALRPVEFTANPIAAYPRSVTGRRTVEDGDIIEASAITLIPFPDQSGAASLAEARAKVARQIFSGTPSAMPQDALPLAMIAVERGAVRWVDMAMVRRETGSEGAVELAFSGRPRALAEAHVLQHRAHLADILDDLQARGMAPLFAASQQFALLPPAGQLPAAAIRPDAYGFSQLYFPPGIDCDLAFVPEDEVAALVDEALDLPPIDLMGDAADLDATGVLVMVPVSRSRQLRLQRALDAPALAISTSAGLAATRPAFDLVSSLVRKRQQLQGTLPDADAARAAQAEQLRINGWHAALEEALGALAGSDGRPPLLWYVRKRAVARDTRTAAAGVLLAGDDVTTDAMVSANIGRLGLDKRLTTISAASTAQAVVRVMALLGAPAIVRSDTLTFSVVHDIEGLLAQPETTAATPDTPGDTILTQPNPARLATRLQPGALRINPAALAPVLKPALSLDAARIGLSRIALARAAVTGTAPAAGTPLKLGESEVLAIAEDYADPKLGDGLAAVAAALGIAPFAGDDARFLGESGKALQVDAGFGRLGGAGFTGLAERLLTAVGERSGAALDRLLQDMA